jgi:hypothetical protein
MQEQWLKLIMQTEQNPELHYLKHAVGKLLGFH